MSRILLCAKFDERFFASELCRVALGGCNHIVYEIAVISLLTFHAAECIIVTCVQGESVKRALFRAISLFCFMILGHIYGLNGLISSSFVRRKRKDQEKGEPRQKK